MNLNRVTLIGRLRDNPRQKGSSAAPAAQFSLETATTSRKGRFVATHVQYHDVEAFGKLAEIVAEYVKKDARIYVEGHLQTQQVDGKTVTHVVADNVIMLGHRSTP